jgi:adenylylsulfate kinase
VTKVFWFTGLSGAGKTTVATAAAAELKNVGITLRVFDGDDVREKMHRHLGFTRADILENNRLIAEMCADAIANAESVLVPIISPYEEGRALARHRLGEAFRLIYFDAPLRHVENSDVKGLYAKARNGVIRHMIGVSDANPYQTPTHPDLTIDISKVSQAQSVARLVNYILTEINER